jgi:hypothetical protein
MIEHLNVGNYQVVIVPADIGQFPCEVRCDHIALSESLATDLLERLGISQLLERGHGV